MSREQFECALALCLPMILEVVGQQYNGKNWGKLTKSLAEEIIKLYDQTHIKESPDA